MTDPEFTIEVICDDPRHARGRPAKIDTFIRLVVGGDWITKEQLGDSPPRQHGWRHHKASGDLGEDIHSYVCALCPPRHPQQLECGDGNLQRALNFLAEQGPPLTIRIGDCVSLTPLRILNAVVSNQP